MGFASQSRIRGRAELGQEWSAIVTELDRRGALSAPGAGALLELGRQCADAASANAPLGSSDDDA